MNYNEQNINELVEKFNSLNVTFSTNKDATFKVLMYLFNKINELSDDLSFVKNIVLENSEKTTSLEEIIKDKADFSITQEISSLLKNMIDSYTLLDKNFTDLKNLVETNKIGVENYIIIDKKNIENKKFKKFKDKLYYIFHYRKIKRKEKELLEQHKKEEEQRRKAEELHKIEEEKRKIEQEKKNREAIKNILNTSHKK